MGVGWEGGGRQEERGLKGRGVRVGVGGERG